MENYNYLGILSFTGFRLSLKAPCMKKRIRGQFGKYWTKFWKGRYNVLIMLYTQCLPLSGVDEAFDKCLLNI